MKIQSEDSYRDGFYGFKITSFEKVDNYLEGSEIVKDYQLTVSDFDFASLNNHKAPEDYTKEEIEREEKGLVSALSYCVINENEVYAEFDLDSYGKFVYITKKRRSFLQCKLTK